MMMVLLSHFITLKPLKIVLIFVKSLGHENYVKGQEKRTTQPI